MIYRHTANPCEVVLMEILIYMPFQLDKAIHCDYFNRNLGYNYHT